MNGVGYSSPFVPAEWIAAHGLRPERFRLHPTEKLTRGVCPYAGALMDAALASGDGKGDRRLLPGRPSGCFAQKAPVPFSSRVWC